MGVCLKIDVVTVNYFFNRDSYFDTHAVFSGERVCTSLETLWQAYIKVPL